MRADGTGVVGKPLGTVFWVDVLAFTSFFGATGVLKLKVLA